MSPKVTRPSCSARAPLVSRPPQDWADLLGTIHYEVVTSPARPGHPRPTGRPAPIER